MRSYKARGIVLHSVKYGESSQIIYLLTDLLGRETYIVQGVKSKKGRGNRAALFQPMFVVEFEGLTSPKMQMHRIREVRSGLVLLSTPFDVRKSTISLFMAEVLYRVVKEVEQNSPLFDFVYSAVEKLDRIEHGVANFHLWFLVQLSQFLGFYPGNEHTAGCCFDIKEGEFTPIVPNHPLHLKPQQAEVMAELMGCDYTELAEVKLSRQQRSSFLTDVVNYFGFHLDAVGKIKSIEILKEVF